MSGAASNFGPEPCVGIFWGVAQTCGMALVTDATALPAAEPYGDFLTHPRGHYEIWEEWRLLGPAGLARRGLPAAIAFREYEEFPRGRIVFDTRESAFIVYADRGLRNPAMAARIVHAFGLGGQRWTMRADPHYRA